MADSTKEQIIRLFYDASPATKTSTQYHVSEQKRIDKTGKAQAKAYKDVEKAQKDLINESLKQNKILDAQLAKSAKERTTTAKRESADRVKAEKAEATAKANSAGQVNALLKQINADETRTKKQELSKQAADAKAARRLEMQGMAEQHKFTMMQWHLEQLALRDQAKAATGAQGAVTGFMGAFIGIGAVVTGVQMIAQYFDEIRRDTIAAAKETIHFREQILELAALKDKLANTGPVLAGNIALRSKTFQSGPESIAMEQHARGAGEAAIGKTISEGDFEELLTETGRLQAMEHSDAGAYGDLAGTIALLAKPGENADDAKARLNKLYNLQKPGKFSNVAQFAHQFSEVAAFAQNDIYTPEELGTYLSAFSEYNPEEAATRLRQITEASASGLMRNRKMKGAPGIDMDTSAEFFTELGITRGMSVPQRNDKIADWIIGQQDAAKKAGKDFLVPEELMAKGIRNRYAAEAFGDIAALKRSGVLGSFQDIQNAAPNPNAISDTFNTRVGSEPTMLQKQAELSHDVSVIKRGSAPLGMVAQLKQAAFDKKFGQGKVTGTFDNFQGAGMITRAMWDSLGEGWYKQVDIEAEDMLRKEAAKFGVSSPKMKFDSVLRGRREYIGDEALADLQAQVQRAGGNPLAGVQEEAKKSTDILVKIEENTRPRGAPGQPNAPVGQAAPLISKPPQQGPGPRQAGN